MDSTRKSELEAAVTAASILLKQFPRGPMGLTPDHIKFSPEYRAAKQAWREAFERLRRYNGEQNKLRKAAKQ